jgi:hypothetical protein
MPLRRLRLADLTPVPTEEPWVTDSISLPTEISVPTEISLPAEHVVVVPDRHRAAVVSSLLGEHWVCLAWDGHVLPGVWDRHDEAVALGAQSRYADEVTRVVQVRELSAHRQADVSRHYETPTVRVAAGD